MRKSASAFTIVELLIVIVVIAILASISIVVYGGIQERALNAQNIQLAKNYDLALRLYAVDHSEYPPNFNSWPCLGVGDIDVNGDSLYDCEFQGNTVYGTESVAFKDALNPYISSSTKPAAFSITSSGTGRQAAGARVWYVSNGVLDGQPQRWFMLYVLKGDGTTCSYGQLVAEAGWPNFTKIPGSAYSYDDVDGRSCLITLPNPATL